MTDSEDAAARHIRKAEAILAQVQPDHLLQDAAWLAQWAQAHLAMAQWYSGR